MKKYETIRNWLHNRRRGSREKHRRNTTDQELRSLKESIGTQGLIIRYMLGGFQNAGFKLRMIRSKSASVGIVRQGQAIAPILLRVLFT